MSQITSKTTLSPTVATSYAGTVGSAVPALNVINIIGDGTTATTSAAGSTVTVTSLAVGMTWTREIATPVAMVVNHGYIPTFAGLTTFTLPATAALGELL